MLLIAFRETAPAVLPEDAVLIVLPEDAVPAVLPEDTVPAVLPEDTVLPSLIFTVLTVLPDPVFSFFL